MSTPTLTFQVRVGIPGSLTIELDAAPFFLNRRAPNLIAPLNQAVLGSPSFATAPAGNLDQHSAQTMSRPWGQGWATPMTDRLIAVGGNLPFQILGFECPSVDTTDNAWGGSGVIDATTDPFTFTPGTFGASIYGRTFAVGDYIQWTAGEIDLITAIDAITGDFTVQRASVNSSPGFAQFGSAMAAQASNFLQLLDPTFFTLWNGSHQVFKFLWDQMIVSAVQITTPGLKPPALLNLFPGLAT